MSTPPSIPLVSVILPAHNRPQYLAQAAQSILAQTLRELELLIVDDASDNPQTVKIAAQIAAQDARARVVRRRQNGGAAAARNTGIAEARAPLIAMMDDDDLSEPQRLEKQAAFLNTHLDMAAVICGRINIDQYGRITKCDPPESENVIIYKPYPLEANYHDPVIGNKVAFDATVMVRRECVEMIGGVRECYQVFEDWDVGYRMQEKFAMAKLPDALYRVRTHRGARVSISENNWRMIMAIDISTLHRRTGKPDPLANGQPVTDALLRAHFSELPPARRRFCIRKSSRHLRYLMRDGKFAELRQQLAFITQLCRNNPERRALTRIRIQLVWWSLIFGKWGFWRGGAL